MLIVDAHLDLAYNALHGRDVLLPADRQTPDEEGVPSVGLPDLRAGGVQLICATIFCEPARNNKPGYRNADEAHAQAWRQMQWYLRRHDDHTLDLITDAAQLPGGAQPPQSNAPSPQAIVLMEGADPIRSAADVPFWFSAGVRIVGLAWKRTRYAGGTGDPGPLSPPGIELVRALDHAGMIHDLSHLAEESLWQLLDISSGPVVASHSNCRAIVPTDRQLSDAMIQAIVARRGIIGINLYDRFLLPPDQQGKRRAKLEDVVRHIDYICQLTGSADAVGLGTDMDGGLGREQLPVEIRSSADLPRLAEALTAAGFDSQSIRNIMGENWIRFFRHSLNRGGQQA